jgi:hypothetical protein
MKPSRCVIGQKDSGQEDVLSPKMAQQLETIHVWHSVIDDNTACARQVWIRQQRGAAAVGMDVEAFELESELQRVTHGLVIVCDQNQVLSIEHSSSSGVPCEPSHRENKPESWGNAAQRALIWRNLGSALESP